MCTQTANRSGGVYVGGAGSSIGSVRHSIQLCVRLKFTNVPREAITGQGSQRGRLLLLLQLRDDVVVLAKWACEHAYSIERM